jgi:hypothetical protein
MKILQILSFTALAFLLTQCYPAGPEYVDEMDLVYSNYDPACNFTAKHTFAIPNKIMKIDDDLVNGGGPNFVKDIYAKQMLDLIRLNMTNNGWSEVDVDSNPKPDVVLAPVAYELTTTYYYGYGGYWDWWYGYGWYYPYPVTTSYSTGSLIVTMADPNDLSPDDKMHAVWGFVVNGVLEGSTASFTQRITKGINQAFTQSQYLKK